MSEYDRHFGRRNIIWKLTNLTRESLVVSKYSPEFSIWLGGKETSWQVQTYVKNQQLGVYLFNQIAERQDFSIGFHVAIIKSSSPGDKLLGSFSKHFEEIFTKGSGYGFPELVSLNGLFDEKILVGNQLTLEMQLELIEKSKVKMLEENYLLDNYEKLVNSEQHSDFVFICSDGGRIHVQKCNIAAQCEAFAAMINAGMSEAASNSAKITDVDSETMLELVRFLYCGRVNNMKRVQERLVIAANKYGLEGLKNICVSSLMESLTPDNVNNVFEIAELLGEDILKENCVDFIKCNLSRLHAQEEEFSKGLLRALLKSVNLMPIRIIFKNDELM